MGRVVMSTALTAPHQVEDLVRVALSGLRAMYRPDSHRVVQTVRGRRSPSGPRLVGEGTNLRYAAIVALGLHRAEVGRQREILAGLTAAELSAIVSTQARLSPDPGAVALAAWAAVETENRWDQTLFDRIRDLLRGEQALPTVDVAWMLTAAVAATFAGPTGDISVAARARLMDSQGPGGLFPHAVPSRSLGRLRAHVGSFADQVYPIQALARFAAANADAASLQAADRCAATICALQGAAGQWWWHYDSRGASVVEAFPVYSVHQHAMAPMVLMDLYDAGGGDHREAIRLGLSWLSTHPEVLDELVDDRLGVVWRKVGRREPLKAARLLNAATTAVRPELRAPGLDRLFPSSVVDHECRPYELGWLLYAWSRPGGAQALETPGVDESQGGVRRGE